MHWIIRLLVSGLSLLVADLLLNSVRLSGFGTAIFAALILGIVNTIIRPILIFFTFPATIATFGLFLLVINAVTYWITSTLVPGFYVSGFWGAFWGAIITSVVTTIVNAFVKD
ncbi:MAG TPA: phage holin family protein [Bacillota bacterium]|nr:phage holin family protein [Bacillota bacterium]